jgi:predicted enzyme related to lactoylglutathione lyase
MLSDVAQPIVFLDIAGKDTAGLSSFYSQVFGWQNGPDGTFAVPVTSPLACAIRNDPPEKRIYVGVDDVTATLAAIEEAGGAVDAPRFEVPGVVILGLFRDPAKNAMGLVEMQSGRPRVP